MLAIFWNIKLVQDQTLRRPKSKPWHLYINIYANKIRTNYICLKAPWFMSCIIKQTLTAAVPDLLTAMSTTSFSSMCDMMFLWVQAKTGNIIQAKPIWAMIHNQKIGSLVCKLRLFGIWKPKPTSTWDLNDICVPNSLFWLGGYTTQEDSPKNSTNLIWRLWTQGWTWKSAYRTKTNIYEVEFKTYLRAYAHAYICIHIQYHKNKHAQI